MRKFHLIPLALAALVLSACGGGGSSSADVRPNQPLPAAPVVAGPNSFLLFPNPQRQDDGTDQTNTLAYTEAYYRAIDPLNERDTLAKYKAKNGFESGTGTEYNVIFGDQRDLGYGRRMYVRRNPDGTLAFYVENYLVRAGADYTYSDNNLEAAILRDGARLVGVNAIEFTPGPNGGRPFPKFYNYEAATLNRATSVDLDGRGLKAMPGPCISCHGGRGDALMPPGADGKHTFNLVRNGVSQHRGDVQARLHPFEADVFQFSQRAGWTRPEQEKAIKDINTWILCTYPMPAGATRGPEDQCRPDAGESEWQGTAAQIVKNSYGGTGLPGATFDDKFVPESWERNGQSTLYREVIATSCRTCHLMRGVSGNSDLDFNSYEKFRAYADRIKYHVFDRGNMPLAKIVYDAFWSSPTRPMLLANFLRDQGYTVHDASGNILRPGRPISDPGPDRVVGTGATRLNGANSLFANGYAWTFVSNPGNATLTEANTATPTFTATAAGTYVLQLVASNGSTAGAAARVTIVVNPSISPAPSAIRFADIKASMQQTAGACTQCHAADGQLPRPPVFYTNSDRNGDNAVDATDEAWFYAEVRGRINFTDIAASPLLRKPSGQHHGGNLVVGFDTTKPPGDPARSRYDLFLNWILNGAPR